MDQKRVIDELTRGKEFAKQLQIHLDNPSPLSTLQTQEILMYNILESYNKSLSLLTTVHGESYSHQLHAGIGMRITKMESRGSFGESPHSEDSIHEFINPNHKDFGAKRKSMEKRTNQVIVRGDMEFEGALDDGYSWRKYGQKDILGTKHPKGYYRCTYRQVDGCLATKQVQKTDADPNTYNMTYRGSHTCNPGINATSTLPLPSSLPPQENELLHSQKILSTFQTSYKDLSENPKTLTFPYPSTSNNNFNFPTLDDTFGGNRSPTFISSATSGSTNFTTSQPRVTEVVESELNDVVYASTYSTTSHKVDASSPFGESGIGNFNFDNSIFFD